MHATKGTVRVLSGPHLGVGLQVGAHVVGTLEGAPGAVLALAVAAADALGTPVAAAAAVQRVHLQITVNGWWGVRLWSPAGSHEFANLSRK